jgi:hypothetical protein
MSAEIQNQITAANLDRMMADENTIRRRFLHRLETSPVEKNVASGEVLGPLRVVEQDGRHTYLETDAFFGDAIRRLSDGATHLYVDGSRYWFSTQPSVTRLAQDRAAQQKDDEVIAELVSRLRKTQRDKAQFAGVHAAPPSSSDVPDVAEARLVILPPDATHTSKQMDSPAIRAAQDILEHRGNSPRIYRNTLLFLAADAARLDELTAAIRTYLAWKSINDDAVPLNLDAFQGNQAKTKTEESNETIEIRIPASFQWLIVPEQPEPSQPVGWQMIRLQGDGQLAERAAARLIRDELMIVEYAGVRLRMDIDKVPLWREEGRHVGIGQLCEDVAQYVYLPRFRDESVVMKAIEDGVSQLGTWEEETFAYASSWDRDRNRYMGLVAGKQVQVRRDSESVLVHPGVAMEQITQDKEKQAAADAATVREVGSGALDATPDVVARDTPEPEPRRVTRFYGTVALSGTRMGRDASRIADEVISHLASLANSEAEITLDIEFKVPEGIPDNVIRTVSENCKTLKFESQGFETE